MASPGECGPITLPFIDLITVAPLHFAAVGHSECRVRAMQGLQTDGWRS